MPGHSTQASMIQPLSFQYCLLPRPTLKPYIPVTQNHMQSLKGLLLFFNSVPLLMQLPLHGITFLPVTICGPQTPQILLNALLGLLFTGLFIAIGS